MNAQDKQYYIWRMVHEALLETNEYEEHDVRDFRGTTEVVLSTPRQFQIVCRSITRRGWVPTEVSYPKRNLVGVTFDCDPTVAVVMSLSALETWSARYNSTPIPELRKAVDNIVNDIIARVQEALSVEASWIGNGQ